MNSLPGAKSSSGACSPVLFCFLTAFPSGNLIYLKIIIITIEVNSKYSTANSHIVERTFLM